MQLMGLMNSFFGGGLSSGGGGLGSFGGGSPLGDLSGATGWSSWAGGGYTGNAPRVGGVDGQGGFPAILHPQEMVIDNTKRDSALSRYSSGNQGAASNSPQAYNLNTTVINNVEYATVEDVRAMGRKSTQDGAAAGKAQTFNLLRNSRAQRTRLGMS